LCYNIRTSSLRSENLDSLRNKTHNLELRTSSLRSENLDSLRNKTHNLELRTSSLRSENLDSLRNKTHNLELCYNTIMLKKAFQQLNIPAQCRKYGLSLWQCPQFLFLMMGIIISATSIAFYLIGSRYYLVDPGIVALVILGVVAILFVISFVIIRSFERLAEASRIKSEFIDIVSHQLRSPLTSLKWLFELLTAKKMKIIPGKRKEYFSSAKENIERMVELVDDLLIVSKIEEGELPLRRKEISLEKLIAGLVSRFKFFAEASNTKLEFYSKKNLPEVFIDPSYIKLVIENLIDNAVRYTIDGGKVEIRLGKKGKNLLFQIKDNGAGIPEKDQKYIFQKFFRSENILREQTRGSGLGLYIAKSIIEKLGGKIWFESQEGKGTTFYFSLPIK